MKTLKRGDRVAILDTMTQGIILDGLVLSPKTKDFSTTTVHVPNYGVIQFDDSSMSMGTFASRFGLLDDSDTRVRKRKRDDHVALMRRAIALWLDKAGDDDVDCIAEAAADLDDPGWSVALDAASR